jgi:hypothetical protein
VLTIPPGALPTYGGLGVTVEHELVGVAELAGSLRPLRAWCPLHVWHGPPAEPVGEGQPLTLTTPPPVALRLSLPSDVLRLGGVAAVSYTLANPGRLRLKRLVLELEATETARHLAATDLTHYGAARHVVELGAAPELAGQIAWDLPVPLAPTLRGRRFALDWRLQATVTLPWRRGVTASAPVRLVDPWPGS